jgi:hypothetical protein
MSMQQNYYNGYNPYLAGPPNLGQDEGDVSLIGPVILLLGLVGIGAAIIIMKDRGRNDYYDDYEEPAVARLRNVIDDIESDGETDDDDDYRDFDDFPE